MFLIIGKLCLGNNIDDIEYYKRKTSQYYYSFPDSASTYALAGLKLAKAKEDSANMAFFYKNLGQLIGETEIEKSIEYTYKAHSLYISLNNVDGVVETYIDLTKRILDPSKRNIYLEKAKFLIPNVSRAEFKQVVFLNIGFFYYLQELYDSAMFYYNKSLKLSLSNTSVDGLAVSYANIGRVFIKHEEYDTAIFLLKKAIFLIPQNDKRILPKIQCILFKALIEDNQYDSAFYYLDLIEDDLGNSMDLALEVYSILADHYTDIGDYKKANIYLLKVASLKSKIHEKSHKNYLTILELEHEAQLQKQHLTYLGAEIEKAEYIRYLLISIVVIILCFGGLAFYQYKQKTYKKRESLLHKKRRAETEKRLLAEKLQHAELRSRHLNSQLRYTNNELAYVAAGSVQNRELLSELKQYVQQTYRKKDLGSIKDSLRNLNIHLMQLIHKDQDERQKLIERTEDINTALICGLKEKFPELSDNDLKLLVLMLLKFNTKEIATMYRIEEHSAMIRRYRLRRKLNMKKRETFEDFFERILPDIPIFNRGD